MNWSDKERLNQRGQALVMGLVFIAGILLMAAYCVLFSELSLRLFSAADQNQTQVLKKLSLYSHVFNEIAFNNQNILANVATTQREFVEAFEEALRAYAQQPYWVTGAQQHNGYFVEALAQRIFAQHVPAAAGGLVMAKALSESNQKLVRTLPTFLQRYLRRQSSAQTFCLAFVAQETQLLLKEPQKPCQLLYRAKQDGPWWAGAWALPQGLQTVFDYQHLPAPFGGETTHYGVMLVPVSFKDSFINSLYRESDVLLEQASKNFWVIQNFLQNMGFLNAPNHAGSSILKQRFKITHPFFYCKYNQKKSCHTPDGVFLKSFFSAHWTAMGAFF